MVWPNLSYVFFVCEYDGHTLHRLHRTCRILCCNPLYRERSLRPRNHELASLQRWGSSRGRWRHIRVLPDTAYLRDRCVEGRSTVPDRIRFVRLNLSSEKSFSAPRIWPVSSTPSTRAPPSEFMKAQRVFAVTLAFLSD